MSAVTHIPLTQCLLSCWALWMCLILKHWLNCPARPAFVLSFQTKLFTRGCLALKWTHKLGLGYCWHFEPYVLYITVLKVFIFNLRLYLHVFNMHFFFYKKQQHYFKEQCANVHIHKMLTFLLVISTLSANHFAMHAVLAKRRLV